MANRVLLPSHLRRELGDIKINEYKSRGWAKGLEYMELFRRKKMGPSMEPTQVIYDETRGITIVGLKFTGDTARRATIEIIPDKGSWDPEPIWSKVASQISSLSLSPSGCLCATTVGGYGPASFAEDLDGLLTRSRPPSHVLDAPPLRDPRTLLDQETSYWASAANPTLQIPSCAIATSNGAFIQTAHESGWRAEGGLSHDAPEVMAVDWQSENVVIKGCKDGGVRLWDKRSPAEEILRFQHPSQINHAKCPDANRIVVAGLDSRLCAYDLRHTEKPTYEFPYYQNSKLGHLAAGFDVCGDYVAATSDNDLINIWDIGINAPEYKPEGNRFLAAAQGHGKYLKFDHENDDPRSLLVVTKDDIGQIGWPREGTDVTLL